MEMVAKFAVPTIALVFWFAIAIYVILKYDT